MTEHTRLTIETTPPLPIEAPRSRVRHTYRRDRTNFEMYGWIFMRASGVVLLGLVLAHLAIMLMLDHGVHRINWAFVAGRYASPFWRLWDLLQLWLAELHGTNGLRVIINDYAEHDQTRFWLKTLLYGAAVTILLLGTLVIFTFSPNIS